MKTRGDIMRRCPRHGNDSVEVIQTIDNSLCYGPCDVHVACDAFNSATILSIKSNMIVMDVALDSMGQASSLKPSSATFVINLEDIIEIRSFCLSESGPALTDEEMEEGIVLLLNNGKACAIESVNDDLCLKAIHSAWQTQLLRLAARVPKLRSVSGEIDVVRAYYHEVTKGILHGTSLDELMALLREFSREVLTNAPLKVIVFDTKEVLGLLVNLWKALLEKVPRTLAISNDPKWKRLIPQERVRRTNIYSQLKATIDESVDLHALQDDFNQYLLTIVADRLKILALVSQSLAAIFFGSELLTLRAEAVTSDDPVSPLGLSSWFAMLFCDPVATICEAVGLDVNTIDSVMLSITEATAAPESPRKSKRGWGTPNKVAPFSPGPLVRASSGLSIDQDAISTLPRLQADVRGRQALLLFEIFRIVDSERAIVLSWSRQNMASLMINFSRMHAVSTKRTRAAVRKGIRLLSERQVGQVYCAQKISSLAAFIMQQSGWRECVDGWVKMLLDGLDLLLSERSIRLHRGVAVSMSALFPSSTRTSFASLYSVSSRLSFNTSLSSLGNPSYDGREQRVSRGIALLTYLSNMLYFMAMDSAAIREVFLQETLNHWLSIANILKLLVPLDEEPEVVIPDVTSPQRDPTSRPMASPSSYHGSSTKLRNSLSNMLSTSWQFLRQSQSPLPIEPVVAAPPLSSLATPTPADRPLQSVPSERSMRSNRSTRSVRTTATRASSAWDLPGAPMHGMTVAEWRLLLTTKLQIEALLFDVLKLRPNQVYAEANPAELDTVLQEEEELPDPALELSDTFREEDEDVFYTAVDDLDRLVDSSIRPKVSAYDPMDVAEEAPVAPGEPPQTLEVPSEPTTPRVSPRGILSNKASMRQDSAKPAMLMTSDSFIGDVPNPLETPQTRAKKRVRMNL